MVSFRIDTELLDKINRLKEPKTDVIHKALELYLRSSENVNTPHKESVNTKKDNVNTKRNINVNTVNHSQQENVKTNDLQNDLHGQQEDVKTNDLQNGQKKNNQKVNQVNPSVQIIKNYEFMEYLKHDNEWLKGRIEHFENTQDTILAKLDIKQVDKDKPSVSWVRM